MTNTLKDIAERLDGSVECLGGNTEGVMFTVEGFPFIVSSDDATWIVGFDDDYHDDFVIASCDDVADPAAWAKTSALLMVKEWMS